MSTNQLGKPKNEKIIKIPICKKKVLRSSFSKFQEDKKRKKQTANKKVKKCFENLNGSELKEYVHKLIHDKFDSKKEIEKLKIKIDIMDHTNNGNKKTEEELKKEICKCNPNVNESFDLELLKEMNDIFKVQLPPSRKSKSLPVCLGNKV